MSVTRGPRHAPVQKSLHGLRLQQPSLDYSLQFILNNLLIMSIAIGQTERGGLFDLVDDWLYGSNGTISVR